MYSKYPKSLKTIVIDGNGKQKTIPGRAFYKIYDDEVDDILEEVVITGDISAIGEAAFAGHYSLTTVELPDDLMRIGYNAF